MYVDFSKLWDQLTDRKMSKGELMQRTGLSSRVVAKLVRNETVTTETVARICEALECGVGDIMECVSDDTMPFSAAYRRFGQEEERSEQYRIVSFTYCGQKYRVYETTDKGDRGTHVKCREDGTVCWWQYAPSVGREIPQVDKRDLFRPVRQGDETVIVLIRGKPGSMDSQNAGMAISDRGERMKGYDIYVMSERAFKQFAAPKNRKSNQ